MTDSIVLRGGMVLTMDDSHTVHETGDVRSEVDVWWTPVRCRLADRVAVVVTLTCARTTKPSSAHRTATMDRAATLG